MRNSQAVKQKHDDFNSALDNWVCIYLSSIFTVRNALRYNQKVSFIYIVICLNRGTDLNRLLISLSQITKMQNYNRRVIWALWHFEKCLNIMILRILVSTSLCHLNIFIVMNKSYKTKNYMLHWCVYFIVWTVEKYLIFGQLMEAVNQTEFLRERSLIQ